MDDWATLLAVGVLLLLSGCTPSTSLEKPATTPSNTTPAIPADVLKLEFTAHLLALERQASDEDPVRCAAYRELCRDAQWKFCSEHLAWWAPAFATLLSRENPRGYYAAAGVFLAALIPAERALLDPPPLSQAVRPSVAEPDDICDGCLTAKG